MGCVQLKDCVRLTSLVAENFFQFACESRAPGAREDPVRPCIVFLDKARGRQELNLRGQRARNQERQ
jgi:hypothetical protein